MRRYSRAHSCYGAKAQTAAAVYPLIAHKADKASFLAAGPEAAYMHSAYEALDQDAIGQGQQYLKLKG